MLAPAALSFAAYNVYMHWVPFALVYDILAYPWSEWMVLGAQTRERQLG